MPSQLLDVAVAYLSLINPPPGATHPAIPPKRIVLTGESTGASLILSLIALLLQLERRMSSDPIHFNSRPLPRSILPAGQALVSTITNNAGSLASFWNAALLENDVLTAENPVFDRSRPDEPGMWPADPPREHFTCGKQMLNHPLIEPLLVTEDMWRGAPPFWIAMGDERAIGPVWMIVGCMRRAGVTVHWAQFEGMCHIWHVMLPRSPSASELMKQWGQALRQLSIRGGIAGQDKLIEEVTLRQVPLRQPEESTSRDVWQKNVEKIRRDNDQLMVWYGHTATNSRL